MFDYSNLLGRIKTVFKTQEAFANALGMSLNALSRRLNNRASWDPEEMLRACKVLNDDINKIPEYFFVVKVQ